MLGKKTGALTSTDSTNIQATFNNFMKLVSKNI